jgi:hypothetical protein
VKLKSLKITAAERKAKNAKYDKLSIPGSTDEYPYGLCLSLEEAALEKLGLDPTDFDIDQTVKVQAVGFVKRISSSKGDMYDRSTLEVQLTKLALEPESTSDALDRGIDEAAGD